MRPLRRPGGGFDDCAGRRRRAWTRRHTCISVNSSALMDNPINPPTHIIGYVERSIWPNRKSGGTMRRLVRRFHRTRKAVREDFALAGCLAASHRLKHDVVAALRIRRAVPRAMKRDEHAIAIALRKLIPVVANHAV